MERLGEAYSGSRWDRDPRRVWVGAALVLSGVFAVVVAILLVTTPLADLVGTERAKEAKWIAGVLAGLGTPAAMGGVVVVLPARRRQRVGVLAGALVCVAGVALFAYAYPTHWTGTSRSLAFPTAITYFLGGSVAFWFVFTAVAGYRLRNTPGGTVRLELTRQGETKTVEVSRDRYREYRQAVRSDGGDTEQVIRELETELEE